MTVRRQVRTPNAGDEATFEVNRQGVRTAENHHCNDREGER